MVTSVTARWNLGSRRHDVSDAVFETRTNARTRLTRGTHMRIILTAVAAILVSAAHHVHAQVGSSKATKKTADTAFASMQERGKMAMGVDQFTSTHKFDSFPDGGRIELQRDNDDSAGVAAIRA